jgi:hypothetical protein
MQKVAVVAVALVSKHEARMHWTRAVTAHAKSLILRKLRKRPRPRKKRKASSSKAST